MDGMDSAELWTRRKERILENVEDALYLAIADIEELEADAHLNGKRQGVVALRNRITEAQKDAAELRQSFRGRSAEITESVDEGLAEKLADRNGRSVGAP